MTLKDVSIVGLIGEDSDASEIHHAPVTPRVSDMDKGVLDKLKDAVNCIKALQLELKEAKADAEKEGKWRKDLSDMITSLKKEMADNQKDNAAQMQDLEETRDMIQEKNKVIQQEVTKRFKEMQEELDQRQGENAQLSEALRLCTMERGQLQEELHRCNEQIERALRRRT